MFRLVNSHCCKKSTRTIQLDSLMKVISKIFPHFYVLFKQQMCTYLVNCSSKVVIILLWSQISPFSTKTPAYYTYYFLCFADFFDCCKQSINHFLHSATRTKVKGTLGICKNVKTGLGILNSQSYLSICCFCHSELFIQ